MYEGFEGVSLFGPYLSLRGPSTKNLRKKNPIFLHEITLYNFPNHVLKFLGSKQSRSALKTAGLQAVGNSFLSENFRNLALLNTSFFRLQNVSARTVFELETCGLCHFLQNLVA